MNFRHMILGLTFALIFQGAQVAAEQFSYPSDNPQVSVTFPDDWTVEPDDNALHASPKDESIYVGFLGIDDSVDDKKVGEVFDTIIDGVAKDVTFGETQKYKINDIMIFGSDGEGKSKEDGTPLLVSFIYLSPHNDGKSRVGLVYFGAPKDTKRYEKDIKSIIQSFTPVSADDEE